MPQLVFTAIFMSQPNITALNIAGGDTVLTLETIVNLLIGQSVKSVAMNGGQGLRIVTQNGVNNDCFIAKAKDGILSGLEYSPTTGAPNSIALGNWQANGTTESTAGATAISFAARHATLPRIDLIFADFVSVPRIDVLAGTASANPQPPTRTSVQAPLYLVWIDPASVATPIDFVLASFQVDEDFPINEAVKVANGLIQSQLPTKGKFIDYIPANPQWDGDVIEVDNSAGAVTLDLPDPTLYAGFERVWRIYGNTSAAVNNIVLDATASGAFTVNGAATDTINTAWRQYTLIARGGAFYGW